MSATEWSELAVRGLPTGTVTLLLADVEGSTRLWETQPEEMTAAIARLDTTLAGLIAAHHGVGRSSRVKATASCWRSPAPVTRWRVHWRCSGLRWRRSGCASGCNTGEIQLRDEGNYVGPTINRTARLRDLAHGGQTVLSGATEPMVARPAAR